jgi:hypothetical protein
VDVGDLEEGQGRDLSAAHDRPAGTTGPVETVCVSDTLNIDLAPDGTI